MKDKLTLLCGSLELNRKGFGAFDPNCMAFLCDFSAFLLAQKETRAFPNLRSFAFWLRRANLDEFKKEFAKPGLCGRGLAFHIAPSNVPLMFAYSLCMGLLCGNSNVVRVSENFRPEEALLTNLLSAFLDSPRGKAFGDRIAIVSYPHSEELNKEFSALADCRVVWGGDSTVEIFRAIPLSDRAGEMYFPDKTSICILNAEKAATLGEAEFANLVHRFFNDTYAMDQNACSSPRLTLWLGKGGESVSKKFWQALATETRKNYEIDAYKSARKLEDICALSLEGAVQSFTKYEGNTLCVLRASALPKAGTLRGSFGVFTEAFADTLGGLGTVCGEKLQTITYFGLESSEIQNAISDAEAKKRIQILPVGGAMNISMRWDGKNFTDYLSIEK